MEQIPLAEAIICINCNTLARGPVASCPHCAGECLVPLERWLSPKPVVRRPGGEVARVLQTASGAEKRLSDHAQTMLADRTSALAFFKRLAKPRRTVPA